MQDRFKFRAWYTPIYSCEDDEKPHYVYDIEQIYDGFTNKGHSELGWVSSFGSLLDSDEYVIEQCTGLKDKNGKLIYEGDILRSEEYPFKGKNGIHNYAAEVCFDEKSATFFYYTFRTSTIVAGRSEGNTGQLDEYEWEVVGNIHENADLLGEE